MPEGRTESGLVEVDGLRIAYERAGEGPALVLLHGYVGDGQATFRRQLDDLSDEFTVVAWDAPGAGVSWPARSPRPTCARCCPAST